MRKSSKWLALTSTLVLSAFAAQHVQAEEVTAQTAVLDQQPAAAEADASTASVPANDTTETDQEQAAADTGSQAVSETELSLPETTTDSEETKDTAPATESGAADTADQEQDDAADDQAIISNAADLPAKPTGTITITNQNPQTGSFDIVVSNVSNPDGVAEVLLPVWSSVNGQDDLKWYRAVQQADETYKASVSISNHLNSLGQYHIHLYYLDKKGKLTGAGLAETTVTRSSDLPAGTLTVVPQNAATGDFDIQVSNIYAPKGLKSVVVPVWSDAGGQDDLVWYTAAAQGDGTYRVKVKVANHKGNLGAYHMHLYYADQAGQMTFVTGQVSQIAKSAPSGQLAVEHTDASTGTFKITASQVANPAGIQKVQLAVWAMANGQNDLVWYTADKQADGTYTVTVKASDHKYETGTYAAHLYYTQNDGSRINAARVETPVSFAPAAGKLTISNNDPVYGTFDITLSNLVSGRGISEVLIPVWADVNGQNDIRWYKPSQQDDGTYKVSINPADHRYETGTYHVHAYYRENDGQVRGAALETTTVTLGKMSANLSTANLNNATGSFDLVVSDIVAPRGLQRVQIPVWSAAGGQDDLIWYTAARQADGTYKATVIAANHKYTDGTYHAHLYLTDALGSQDGVLSTTSATLTLPEKTGVVTVSPVNQSNWSFEVTVSNAGAKAGINKVEVAVWSDAGGQDDIKWHTAVRQADGTYKVIVRLANHSYTNGLYHVHTYYTLGNGTRTGVAPTTTTVSTAAPRAQIQRELADLQAQFNQLFAGIGGEKSLYITPADGPESLLIKDGVQRSASTIKLFVLASFYAKVARGELNPNHAYTVSPSEIVTASVSLTNAGGRTFSLSQLAYYMVQTSDNTATNIVMRHIGGVEAVNSEIRRLGYTQTRMERYMHDAAAINAGKENYISAQEAGNLLKNIYNKTLINNSVDSTMLNNLGNNYYPLWLTANIKDKTTVYDKPGNHTGFGVENDIAVITKNGRAYIVALLTQGAWNQNTAIRNFGSAVYNRI